MNGEDYAACHMHLNFEHLMKSFRDFVTKHCKCRSNNCERWETHENEENICLCDHCKACPIKQRVLSLPYSSLIKYLCCNSKQNVQIIDVCMLIVEMQSAVSALLMTS